MLGHWGLLHIIKSHLDLQSVTFDQAHLVDFDTVASTCQGRHGDEGARARHQ